MTLAHSTLFRQFGDFTLNLLPHMPMKLKFQFAGRALEIRSLSQICQRMVILFPANRAGDWYLHVGHNCLPSSIIWAYSVGQLWANSNLTGWIFWGVRAGQKDSERLEGASG